MAKEKSKDNTAVSESEEELDEGQEDSEEEDADADEESDESDEGEEDEGGGSKRKESDKDSDQNLDWKKTADNERGRRKKAEDALAEDRYKASERARKGEDDDEEPGEDKPLTAKQLQGILAKEREATRKEVLAGRVKEIAADITDSQDEADAVVEIFNNRGFPSDIRLEDQVREAYYIAHGPRLLAKRDELRRSLKSKDTRASGGSENTHRDAPRGGAPKLSPQDNAEMQRLGFTWDGKRYSKKLASGKLLVKDWKSKKTFISAK